MPNPLPRGSAPFRTLARLCAERLPRRALWVVGVLVVAVLFLVPAGDAAPRTAKKRGGAAAEGGMSAMQFAARHQLEVLDAGSCVTLRGPYVTVRLYPGTRRASVAGHVHSLKGIIERRGGKVHLPSLPAAFLSKRLMARRQEIVQQRRRAHIPTPRPAPTTRPAAPKTGTLPPAGSLPDWKPLDRSRRPATVRPKRTPSPAAAVRAPDPSWAPRTADRGWKYVVIHHSDDNRGNAEKYDRHHREVNGWDSLGYHFVIGNGTLSGDGEVEIGPRWPVQKHGAHARNHAIGDNRYNEQGVGVCLVGDFDEGGLRPSQRQMDQLVRLTRWLMQRYRIPASRVIRHCDACDTECPGKHFPWIAFQRRIK